MSAPSPTKAIVVGAGAVGVCCAAVLRREGLAVTMLDPAGMGRGCAEGTAGIFATCHVAAPATPAAVKKLADIAAAGPSNQLTIDIARLADLLPWFGSFALNATRVRAEEITNVLVGALARAMPAMESLLGKGGVAAHLRQSGWLFTYATDAAFRGAAADWELRRRCGIAVHELSSQALAELEPHLAQTFRHGVFMPEIVHTADPRSLFESIGTTALQGGAIFLKRAVSAIEMRSDGRLAVLANGEEHLADVVVVAAGPRSAAFATASGSTLPHAAERGYGLTFPSSTVRLNRPVSFVEEKAVAASLAPGLRMTMAGELTSVGTEPNLAHVDKLIGVARKAFRGVDTTDVQRWSSDRSATPDGLPIISRSPHHDRLLFAFGHGHLGVTLAGLTGALIGDLALGRTSSMDLSPFRIDRF
jgi:D-amino-acid dehydrogenase